MGQWQTQQQPLSVAPIINVQKELILPSDSNNKPHEWRVILSQSYVSFLIGVWQGTLYLHNGEYLQ